MNGNFISNSIHWLNLLSAQFISLFYWQFGSIKRHFLTYCGLAPVWFSGGTKGKSGLL
jgi:hypothetical protein